MTRSNGRRSWVGSMRKNRNRRGAVGGREGEGVVGKKV